MEARYELVPATDGRFRLRIYAPWVSRVEEHIFFGTVVLHGNVKKVRSRFFHRSFFSFVRLNFTNFRDFPTTVTLTDARKKTKYEEVKASKFSRIAMKNNHADQYALNSPKPWSKTKFL